jgi:hypothetical protein
LLRAVELLRSGQGLLVRSKELLKLAIQAIELVR